MSWLPSWTGVNEYVGGTTTYMGSLLSSYYYGDTTSVAVAGAEGGGTTATIQMPESAVKDVQEALESREDGEEDEGKEKKKKDGVEEDLEEDFVTIDIDAEEKERRTREEEEMLALEKKMEKRILDKQEKVVGCFEPGCDQLFGWTVGYRICAGYV